MISVLAHIVFGYRVMKIMCVMCTQYPSIGSTRSRSLNNHVVVSGAAVSGNEPAEALIGRKVWTRWPEDNSFYEAVVTQYNAVEVTSYSCGTFASRDLSTDCI